MDQLIHRQGAMNFSSGFLTGLGGLATFAVAVPAALTAAYLIRFRLCLALALLGDLELLCPTTITCARRPLARGVNMSDRSGTSPTRRPQFPTRANF